MGEEDSFDLDDDLGLDDDGGGDDFAGSLDDALGDDLDDGGGAPPKGGKASGGGGGGAGGGGADSGDSELDSFFEDLSSIEDMDGDAPAPQAKAAPQAQAAPAQSGGAPAPAAAPIKFGKPAALKKYLKLAVVVLVLGGAGAGAWFFFSGEPEEVPPPVMDSMPQMPAMPQEEVVKIEKPAIRIEPSKMVEPPAPVEPEQPVKRMVPTAQFLVQIATCSFDQCKEDYTDALRRLGEPVYTQTVGEKFDFIELITSEVFNYQEASVLAEKINKINKQVGQASVVSQSNGYRVTLGTFPALDRAKDLKFNLEKELQKEKVRFNLEHVRKDYEAIKVYAGPYDSKEEAKKVLFDLRKDPNYQGAFLVRF